MIRPNNATIWPQQVTPIYAQQTSQQTSGIDISAIINMMLPLMVIMAMMRGMVGMVSTPKRVKSTTTESNPPKPLETSAPTPAVATS